MVSRARLAAVTAGLLAGDGAPGAAVRLLDKFERETREEYFDLHRRLDRNDAERAVEQIQQVESVMRREVGKRLPERDAPLVLEVIAAA